MDAGPSACDVRTRYAVYGLVVESAFPLGSLSPAGDGAAADLRILRADGAQFDDRTSTQSVGEAWYRHASLAGGGIRFEIPGLFRAEVSADGRTALCAPVPESDPHTLEANLLTFIVGIALTLRGEEPLHATVVRCAGRAIGLLGSSGSGKSTLAGFLVAQGAELVTDDVLRTAFVDGVAVAYPGPARLKLFDEDAALLFPSAARTARFNPMSGKRLIETALPVPREGGVVPLSALYWLDDAPAPPGSPVVVREVRGLDAVRILLAATVHCDHRTAARASQQLRAIERLANAVPMFGAGYARRYEMLPAVAAALATADAP